MLDITTLTTAWYGSPTDAHLRVDAKAVLRAQLVVEEAGGLGRLDVAADGVLFGDPCPETDKVLEVRFERGGDLQVVRVAEASGERLVLTNVRFAADSGLGGVDAFAHNDIYGKILQKVKRLGGDEERLLRETIPKVVVIGQENSGKSSTLERIVQRRLFPQSVYFCTRIVTKLMLRHSDRENTIALKLVDAATAEVLARESGDDEEFGGTQDLGESGKDLREYIRGKMDTLLQEKYPDDHKRRVRDDCEFHIEIRSADCVNLDLVDLPGVVTHPADVAEKTEALTRKYIQDDNSLVVYILSAHTDSLRSDNILKMLHEVPRARSMVVLTKVDNDDPDRLRDRLHQRGDAEDLDVGHLVPVVNTPRKPLELAAQAEQDWLQGWCNETGETYDPQSMGLPGVLRGVSTLLQRHMVSKWAPHQRKRCAARAGELRAALAALGADPAEVDPAEVRDVVTRRLLEHFYPAAEAALAEALAPPSDDGRPALSHPRAERLRVRQLHLTHYRAALGRAVQTALTRLPRAVCDAVFGLDELPLRLCRFVPVRERLEQALEAVLRPVLEDAPTGVLLAEVERMVTFSGVEATAETLHRQVHATYLEFAFGFVAGVADVVADDIATQQDEGEPWASVRTEDDATASERKRLHAAMGHLQEVEGVIGELVDVCVEPEVAALVDLGFWKKLHYGMTLADVAACTPRGVTFGGCGRVVEFSMHGCKLEGECAPHTGVRSDRLSAGVRVPTLNRAA